MISKFALVSSSLLLLLTACTSTPVDNPTPLPQLTFAHLRQIPVNVAEMEFLNNVRRGAQPWDISSSLPTPPDIAMRRYLEQRYKSTGGEGTLTITLKEANIHHEEVPSDNMFLEHIIFANMHEYTYEIIVALESLYFSGKPDRDTDLRFVRKVVLSPQASPAYRDTFLQRSLEELISDIDEAMIGTLAHEFNIIAKRDIPVKSIDIKTEKPVEEQKSFRPMSLFQQEAP